MIGLLNEIKAVGMTAFFVYTHFQPCDTLLQLRCIIPIKVYYSNPDTFTNTPNPFLLQLSLDHQHIPESTLIDYSNGRIMAKEATQFVNIAVK